MVFFLFNVEKKLCYWTYIGETLKKLLKTENTFVLVMDSERRYLESVRKLHKVGYIQ